MSSVTHLGAAAVTILLVACASIQVQTDRDPEASFDGYRTFDFKEGGGEVRGRAGAPNPMVAREIEAAVRDELTSSGYRHASDDPSFEVAFYAAVEEKLDVETMTTYYGYRRRGVWIEETEVREYDEGTLVIDIVDGTSDELVWRGTATAELRDVADADERRSRIREAVQAILAEFPPGMTGN